MQLPTEDDLRTWSQHTGASSEQNEALLAMLSVASVEYTEYTVTADLVARGALARRQTRIEAIEAAAARIGEYQPGFLPGLVQTPVYTRALLGLPGSARSKGASEAELDRIVAARAKRQELLSEPGRRWEFVVGESALWSPPGTRKVQLDQLDHLVAVSDLPGVDVGVIPLQAPMPVLPLSGFRLLDEEFVFVESLAGEQRLDDPEEIAPIIRAFEALRAAAVTGQQAMVLIQRVAAGLKR